MCGTAVVGAGGRLVGKGITPVSVTNLGQVTPSGHIRYTVSIFCKDGRYKYSLSDFRHEYEGVNTSIRSFGALEQPKPKDILNKHWEAWRREAASNAEILVSSLKTAMTKKAASDF